MKGLPPLEQRIAREALAAVQEVEGERPCERCGGSGKRKIDLTPCPDCKDGLVRADRLVSLNAVVEALGNEPLHPQHVITVKRDEDDAA